MPSVPRFPRNRTNPTRRLALGLRRRISVFAAATCLAPKVRLGTIEAPSPIATTFFIASTLSNSIKGLGGGPASASQSVIVRRSADCSEMPGSPFWEHSVAGRAEWRQAHLEESDRPNPVKRVHAIVFCYRRILDDRSGGARKHLDRSKRNAAAARRAVATDALALRSAACFPRASGARALGPLRCARRTSLSSAHARPSQCGVRGNSSSWRSPPSTYRQEPNTIVAFMP
jgi:hypothetical protein